MTFQEARAHVCSARAGQKLLDSLAETWDFFFCDVLSMLQAIFHPVQVHECRVRELVYDGAPLCFSSRQQEKQ